MLSIILHTRNRANFLERALDIYSKSKIFKSIEIIVTDQSEFEYAELVNKVIKKYEKLIRLKFLMSNEGEKFSSRIKRALEKTESKYILLAADDDFYFDDWIESTLKIVEYDENIGVVHGNILRFKLENYEPYNKIIEINVAENRNPRIRWLEGETIQERYKEIGDKAEDWASIGWYSLIRRNMLEKIVCYAESNNIDGYFFERFLHLAESALSKTIMIDKIYLARQIDDKFTHYYSTVTELEATKEINYFRDKLIKFLLLEEAISREEATHLTDQVLKCEWRELSNTKSILRQNIKKIFIKLNFLKILKFFREKTNRFSLKKYSLQRNNFPPNYSLDDYQIKMKILEKIINSK